MKKICALLCAALILLGAAGCGKRSAASSSGSGSASASAPQEPVNVGTLTVELPRELDTKTARAAMEQLPLLLEGVSVESVHVTFGTSYAATASALEAGSVMLAFLPADVFAECCETASPILADAGAAFRTGDSPEDWNAGSVEQTDSLTAGTRALICTAPTEYGKNMAQLFAAGKTLSWEELERARWGVLGSESTAGYRCAELWLEDGYQGRGLSDVSSVTTYDSWEELLRAAAEGQVDLVSVDPAQRELFAQSWAMETTRTDASGRHGFGRSQDIHQELPAVAVTPRLFSWVAAVTPTSSAVNTPEFYKALEKALENAFEGPAERAAAIGAEHYAPVRAEDLDGVRRLTAGAHR